LQPHWLSDSEDTTISNYLCCGDIPIGGVVTHIAAMNSFTQVFFACMRTAVRTNLTCVVFIDFKKKDIALPTDIRQNIEKLSVGSIKCVLSK